MTPDGRQESDDSESGKGQADRERSQFATAAAATDNRLTSNGDRWQMNSFCTERERSVRWPIG